MQVIVFLRKNDVAHVVQELKELGVGNRMCTHYSTSAYTASHLMPVGYWAFTCAMASGKSAPKV
jgi:hypothetical protein